MFLWLLFLPIVAISASSSPSLFDYVCPSPDQDNSMVIMYTENVINGNKMLTSLYVHMAECIEMETTSASIACSGNQLTIQQYNSAGCIPANKVGSEITQDVDTPDRISTLLYPNINVPTLYATCTLSYFTEGDKDISLLTNGYTLYPTSCNPYTTNDYPVGVLYVAPGYDVFLPSGDVFNAVNDTTCKKSDDFMVVTTSFNCNDTCFELTDTAVAVTQQVTLPTFLSTVTHKSSSVSNDVSRKISWNHGFSIAMIVIYVFLALLVTILIIMTMRGVSIISQLETVA